MRFLLLIPVFVLFLSKVPFIQVMPVEVKVVLAEKQEEKREQTPKNVISIHMKNKIDPLKTDLHSRVQDTPCTQKRPAC